jgi:hypothetical protein
MEQNTNPRWNERDQKVWSNALAEKAEQVGGYDALDRAVVNFMNANLTPEEKADYLTDPNIGELYERTTGEVVDA